MQRRVAELPDQQAEGARLDALIARDRDTLGFPSPDRPARLSDLAAGATGSYEVRALEQTMEYTIVIEETPGNVPTFLGPYASLPTSPA